MLLLDEATCSLDPDTERRVLQNLSALTDDTVIAVTHRPAALEVRDKRIEFFEWHRALELRWPALIPCRKRLLF